MASRVADIGRERKWHVRLPGISQGLLSRRSVPDFRGYHPVWFVAWRFAWVQEVVVVPRPAAVALRSLSWEVWELYDKRMTRRKVSSLASRNLGLMRARFIPRMGSLLFVSLCGWRWTTNAEDPAMGDAPPGYACSPRRLNGIVHWPTFPRQYPSTFPSSGSIRLRIFGESPCYTIRGRGSASATHI
jgi:hypothetical protein